MSRVFKYPIGFVFFFLYCFPLKGQEGVGENPGKVSNPVKTITISSLRLNKDIEKRNNLDHLIRFDREGRKTEEVYYDSVGLELFKITNFYEGKRLAARIYCAYRDTLAKTVYLINEKGSPKEEYTATAEGQLLSRYSFSCNAQGKVVSSLVEITPENYNLVKQVYRFDDIGFYIYQFLGEIKTGGHLKFSYEYDKTGILNKIAEVRTDSVSLGSILYDRNKAGQIREFSVRHPNGKRYKCYYKYNDHGQLKEESRNVYLNTVLLDQEKNEFNLDAHGNIKKRLRYRMNHDLYMLYTYSYEFYEE
jgi:hypothetical protein